MAETRKLRVFLCHSSQDKPIVRELYQRLNAEGWIDPWLDEEELLPGQNWEMEIEKAVETTDSVIVCFSTNSINIEIKRLPNPCSIASFTLCGLFSKRAKSDDFSKDFEKFGFTS